MINLYPANKMENLLALLNKISQLSPVGVFNQEVIIVQNAGMQHWLNLAIARERGISMNMRYALPAQYLWKLIRTLASDDKVPEQSPYSREVLTWRIYALLATDTVLNDDAFTPVTRYWLEQNISKETSNSTADLIFKTSSKVDLKRYQLAGQMADLYEQYLIFRPQWLDAWQRGEEVIALSAENKWQAKLWQLLISELPYNPVELLTDAIANMADKLSSDPNVLPKRMSFFGINTMAPMWLNFINALSEYIEVDFFHLNPCFSYWGDIINEKQAFKKLSHWSSGANNDEHLFVGNPLLANFGQQGREFLALLQDYSTVNVELFVKASNDNSDEGDHENSMPSACILHQLQNDILALVDATEKGDVTEQLAPLVDDSITIVSCHSALREVQALHDYLLHQFNDTADNQDKLTPKDVLVMCPQIEQYAPYVNAVFTRGWQDLTDEVPPLPCSIADRSAKDSDPLIAAFSELLALPDSRFQVSQLLSFIRLPAVANKFAINAEDSEKISLWLQQATIHWGLDQAHKAALLGEKASNSFTWQQGLSRLLQGFAYSDTDSIYQDQLLLGVVEGDDAILLGQLMLFIEQLQHFSHQLNSARTAKAWQRFLLSQLEQLFSTQVVFSTNTTEQTIHQTNTQIDNSIAIIEQAISSLVEYCEHAHFDEKIELPIIVDFLNNHFSQSDASKQFMVGQVTFCSMLPMRSIPFKVIAVLGLNDGEFPRQRPALGFDLIAQNKAILGDRSRRGDDRYLFLEALISARKALYLSYQGRNIRNNNEKQPSLVLKELMDYLVQGYGWQFEQESSDIYQMPMQPYSEDNYIVRDTKSGFKPSFDANWLTLGQSEHTGEKQKVLLVDACDIADKINTLSATELIRFFQHPSKVFAQQVLNLYLDSSEVSLDDVEPFSANHLENYLLKQDLLAANLVAKNSATIAQVIESATLSGKFPDLPSTQLHFDDALDASSQLAQEIIEQGCDNPELIDCQIVLNTNNDTIDGNLLRQSITLIAQLPVKVTNTGVQLVFYRSSTAKPKDLFTLYLHHLIMQVWQQQNSAITLDSTSPHKLLAQVKQTRGFYFNTKAQKVEQYCLSSEGAQEAEAELIMLLSVYTQGQKQALMFNGELADQVFKESRGKRVELTQERFDQFWQGSAMPTGAVPGFGSDAYIHYFWPQCPDIDTLLPEIEAVYQGLYNRVLKEKAVKVKVSAAKASQSTVKTTKGASR
ncbi:MAG: exodeoxyribonuclease V subunit gamma [Colwellia sp.]|nr:MAG: exodeoxyribonuclease V subunit gamma [Colwellia sp.]